MPKCILEKKQEFSESKSESSPLREALKKHFEAFDGLTEQAQNTPIYKDKESENEHTKQ